MGGSWGLGVGWAVKGAPARGAGVNLAKHGGLGILRRA